MNQTLEMTDKAPETPGIYLCRRKGFRARVETAELKQTPNGLEFISGNSCFLLSRLEPGALWSQALDVRLPRDCPAVTVAESLRAVMQQLGPAPQVFAQRVATARNDLLLGG